MGSHLDAAGKTWTRRFAEEKESEQWLRKKRDRVEVPGLTPRSETLLQQLDQMKDARSRAGFVDQLEKTTEGRQALDEASSANRMAIARPIETSHKSHAKPVRLKRSSRCRSGTGPYPLTASRSCGECRSDQGRGPDHAQDAGDGDPARLCT
ncbi:hypothetical protein [Pseudorhizobium flavum]|jgi:hypothetical protein|uniref:Uncharacterized protein n=1 Tax=Pseudorhizobium flavum TaxID=1335061 RepID=A0A7W9Z217_9HYPH|nr:hypothetical protein [Pseudorhizobium flavum]MBB6182618.1 hypothetical protein [Pseudorhizobium flavum]